MALKLIVGPPNSGRAGAIRRGLDESLGDDPILVVPTADDADRFERELAEDGGALGVEVMTFRRLFDQVVRTLDIESPPALTDAQRTRVEQRALTDAPLRSLRRSARRPGFLPALHELLDQLGAAQVKPGELEKRAREIGDQGAVEVAQILAAYEALRDRLGASDPHRLAGEAISRLRASDGAWTRPVFAYGFDDLTEEEFEMVAELAKRCAVTFALAYEERPALAARAALHRRLSELEPESVQELNANGDYTQSDALYRLERGFASRGAEPIEADEGLVLMRSAGARAEAEAIAAEVKRLIESGADPDRIAIVLRSPARRAALFEQVLASYGVDAAVDGRIPLSRTATGRALGALLRIAFETAEANELLVYLRAPGRAKTTETDTLERRVRRDRIRDAGEALAALRGPAAKRTWDRIEALREAKDRGDLLPVLAESAREIAERPSFRDAPRPDRTGSIELRAAGMVAGALEEIADLDLPDPKPTELAHLLDSISVPLWHGPPSGRVRVLAPYRLRARRYSHVFVASLQDGEFPRRDVSLPVLSEERRDALGLPARADPAEEERYLFHVCLSRPTERLYLCWRSSDEDGRAVTRSPFLEEVRDLLLPGRPEDPEAADRLEDQMTRIRDASAVVHDPTGAPTERALARALAAYGLSLDHTRALQSLAVGQEAAGRIAGGLEAAAGRLRLPGPLAAPAVLDELGRRALFGASTLESYAECPYRWFVNHELKPEPLGPRPEPMVRGGVVHKVLERLYGDPPAEGSRPRPETLSAWSQRALELVEEETTARGLEPVDAGRRADYRLIEAMVLRQLEREAESELVMEPEAGLVEASFGTEREDAKLALEIDGFSLHGRIDRIDVVHGEGPNRPALVRDYKSGREVTAGEKLAEEGKLQLPLYMIAARELWGLDPIAAVYEPLGARGKGGKPRGLLSAEERDGLLPARGFVRSDFYEPDELEHRVAAARQRAIEIVAAMRAGTVDRDPIGGECPFYCTFQSICRRERAARVSEEIASSQEKES